MKKNILVNGISTYVEMTAEEIAKIEARENSAEAKAQKIEMLKDELAKLDYIGIKIATGRAKIEDYADEIARMTQLAEEINQLEEDTKI